ncbi:hypothetical protein F7Q99_12520 [Streptomyces kaniharaensis]|uniref:Uncharacterized protein n=1 Tax=Streptomyces kaniharaensis TaxID=212423 RepID=A0A6N7KRY8_9ACTN|nr:hypothetical protein [Streptomyces kaniharaensis]MQS13087.1 hypothetical protein [Streptomyces kaniharaensis]
MSDNTVTGAPNPEPTPTVVEQPAVPPTPPAAGPEQATVEPARPAADQEQPPAEPEQPAVAQPRPASRRLLRAGAATVAAALVGVAIGIGIIKTQYDDPAPATAAGPSAAPAPTATATPFGAKSNGNHFGSLRDLLLPVPAGYELGPDEGGYGNDDEIGADQLHAELDAELQQIPKDKRDKLRAYWESLHVRATGVRTYRASGDDLVIGLKLRQFNQQEVQKLNEYTAVFTGDTGLFRIGPEIPNHPEAHCYLMPAPPSAPIDYLECSAAEGDLLVVMNAEGVAPLPKDKIVALFTMQLDRLARPGASV